jgi:hypothetical protein
MLHRFVCAAGPVRADAKRFASERGPTRAQRARSLGGARAPGKEVLEPFLAQHGERLAQSIREGSSRARWRKNRSRCFFGMS